MKGREEAGEGSLGRMNYRRKDREKACELKEPARLISTTAQFTLRP